MAETQGIAPRPAGSAIHARAHAAHYNSALHRRQIALRQPSAGTLRHAVFVKYGSAAIAAGDAELAATAPSLIWSSSGVDGALTIETGSVATVVAVSDDLFVEAIGQTAESVFLRYLLDRSFVASVARDTRQMRECEDCFAGIDRELAHDGTGSWMLVAAYLRIIVINLWRGSGIEEFAGQNKGDTPVILQKFRHLVELHFREHWTIGDYCAAIGLSHDRLHALCTRTLGRTPLQLLHERVTYEGQLLLERSVLTVDQISEMLGFRDASAFSHFFKRRTGLAPRAYRNNFTLSHGELFTSSGRSFADWP